MSQKRILSVGQCFADHGSISRTFAQHFQAEVVGADAADEALALLRRGGIDLVLVNRVLDADLSLGMEILRQVQADPELRRTPVMLVSNYDDAQREAVEAGGRAGFGKASLGQPRMLAQVRAALGITAPAS
jgi:two-component system chemotaxis response regulator CheY